MYVLKHSKTGQVKEVKSGFSWTSLFFGVFVPIVRGDMKGFIFQFAAAFFTAGISWLVVPFIYNKRYLNRLIDKGYEII